MWEGPLYAKSLKWCRKHLEELRGYLPLKNGIASPSTACRILSGNDEELFALGFMEYYNNTGTEYITGMKILPIQTSELKALLRAEAKYPQIYKMLDNAHNSNGAPKEWYENHIFIMDKRSEIYPYVKAVLCYLEK